MSNAALLRVPGPAGCEGRGEGRENRKVIYEKVYGKVRYKHERQKGEIMNREELERTKI
jgi:hypothetical protein